MRATAAATAAAAAAATAAATTGAATAVGVVCAPEGAVVGLEPFFEVVLVHLLDVDVQPPIFVVDVEVHVAGPRRRNVLADEPQVHEFADEARVLEGVVQVERAVAVDILAVHVTVEFDAKALLFPIHHEEARLSFEGQAALGVEHAVDFDIGCNLNFRAVIVEHDAPIIRLGKGQPDLVDVRRIIKPIVVSASGGQAVVGLIQCPVIGQGLG